MKIALIGYGKMGHAVEAYAMQRGHSVVCRIDKDDPWPAALEADVAVEFTTPQTAVDNLLRCFAQRLPVVCGTTGWYDRYDEVKAKCLAAQGTLLAATNFSLGMNIMFAINERLAELMRVGDRSGANESERLVGCDYKVSIAETHHIHKLDAPSGTAITLQQQIVANGQRPVDSVPIESFRVGEVPGTHTVVYDSEIDTLTLTHEAHSRLGLAQGAVIAAEWLAKARPGVYTMKDILK